MNFEPIRENIHSAISDLNRLEEKANTPDQERWCEQAKDSLLVALQNLERQAEKYVEGYKKVQEHVDCLNTNTQNIKNLTNKSKP